ASKNAINNEFTFADRIALPEMPGVSEAYLGIVPAKEFIHLLRDESGHIARGIFYDNVRDWQDYNQVNSEIRKTLEDPVESTRFVLMNNGVTLIAKKVRPTGNKLYVEDYQIVNGCQTSHVLFNQGTDLPEHVSVPLRVIATSDEAVTNSVIKATNRQTEVKAEQLISLSDFQKQLESHFISYPANRRLFYERRSRQYNADVVEKTRIITPPNLIRAYASFVRGEPHRTTRSYRTLLQMLGKQIFGPDHQIEPYYLAASALYRLEFLYRSATGLDSKFRPARYHILYALRLLLTEEEPPPATANKARTFAEKLLEGIWGEDSDARFKLAAEVVEEAAGGDFHRDTIRTQGFTDKVQQKAIERRAIQQTVSH
ncbi:MAG: AIPR family protein, partial [Caldilineaceae bacterium]